MSPSLDTSRFLEDLTAYRARNYLEAINALIFAKVRKNKVQDREARERLSEVIRETLGACEVLGATIMLRRAAAWLPEERNLMGRERDSLMLFSETPAQTILPRVTFKEAVQDMVERTPVTLKNAANRTALRISQLYESGDVIAFVNSADQAVTEKVQRFFSEALKKGITEAEVGRMTPKIVEMVADQTKGWSESYARMAFTTNANTAITAGRFRQANDQDVAAVIPAFQFQSADKSVKMGGTTRHNHWLCDGLIFKTNNPIWGQIASPLGYNCHCDNVEMGGPLLRRMGRLRDPNDYTSVIEDRGVPAGGGPDPPPFLHGGRPDLFMSAVAGR